MAVLPRADPRGAGTEATVIDERPSHAPIDVSFIGTLREKQQTAADALLAHELGVLSAPTGFGKTVIGAHLIGSIRARTLVIVPSVSLPTQWRARIGEFLAPESLRIILIISTFIISMILRGRQS